MAQINGLNRRNFLRSAGITAIAGAVSGSTTLRPVTVEAAANGKFDFDTPYNRLGTDSTKWDSAVRTNNMETGIIAGMGIADMDFKCAPSITEALTKRIQHENWGYLDMQSPGAKAFTDGIIAWNKKRYNVDVNPESVVITTGVHPGIMRPCGRSVPPEARCC
jgi:cystathionine beta-lyase